MINPEQELEAELYEDIEPEECLHYVMDEFGEELCDLCYELCLGADCDIATEKPRRCRICGCTDNDCSQCIEKTGEPCHWVEQDLCSACVEAAYGKNGEESG
jgi:hypothetical protein